MLLHSVPFKKQTGAALLALMLVLIIGSSYFLVTKLNTNLALTRQSEETGLALNAAKIALIGYAITFPDHDDSGVIDGPGYLPCPDLNNDGSAASNCSAGGNTTIGRLPNQTLRLEELRDASGQRLWYALSENFRFGRYKTIPLNSESPSSAELSVNGTGDIVAVIFAPGAPVGTQNRDPDETDILLEIANYLEDGNSNKDGSGDLDTDFVTNANVDFNDRLVVITRQELMEAVEKRVLGEVRKMLTDYFNDPDYGGAYPWLTPFADPKTDMRRLRGSAGSSSTGLVLDDNNQDFNEWGVAVNDVIYNITDGSVGYISAINDSTRITVSSLAYGTDNDFDEGDVYTILTTTSNIYSKFSGMASAGSSNLNLEDTGKNFEDLGVAAGDIVENISDLINISSGMVESVSDNTIILKSLRFSNGANDVFNSGDFYQIRNNVGQATGGSGGQVLEDTSKNFNVVNVLAGDLVMNHSDGSVGRVTAVAANTLTVDGLDFGTNNVFANGDYYSIPRYNTDNATREGLLSFHEVGEYFRTDFSLDWDITQANGAQRAITINATSADASYTATLESHIEGALGTVGIDIDDGQCIWATEEIIECTGINKSNFLQGATTSGSDSVFLIDSGKNFNTYGIKPGDVIQNYDDTLGVAASGTATAGSGELLLVDTATDFSPFDPSALYNFIITKNNNLNEIAVIAEIVAGPNAGESNTLRLIPSPADAVLTFDKIPPDCITSPPCDTWEVRNPQKLVVNSVTANDTIYTVQTTATIPDMDANEYYRILTATGSLAGTATAGSSGTTLEDTLADFSNIEVGDIVENTTDGAFGIITSIPSSTTLTALLYLPTNPADGTTRNFSSGESYVIHYDYVGARQYELETRYFGVPYVRGVNAARKRDVCIGYEDISSNPDCSPTATTQATALPSNNNIAIVTITDLLDITENTASTATITIDGSTSGSMRLSDIDYYLREADEEIPGWFITNKWHQLVYIAYSAGYSPNGGAICIVGTDCLTLEQTDGVDTLSNNAVRAIVLIAGEEVQTTLDSTCSVVPVVDQDRSTGTMNEYFELKNCDDTSVLPNDDEFQQVKLPTTLNFNDQLKIIN